MVGKNSKSTKGRFYKKCGSSVHKEEWPHQNLKRVKGEKLCLKKGFIEKLKSIHFITNSTTYICKECMEKAGLNLLFIIQELYID